MVNYKIVILIKWVMFIYLIFSELFLYMVLCLRFNKRLLGKFNFILLKLFFFKIILDLFEFLVNFIVDIGCFRRIIYFVFIYIIVKWE